MIIAQYLSGDVSADQGFPKHQTSGGVDKADLSLHEAVFGLTFVALDPDGHRIRVCTPDD